jgi:hypothetical protein
MLVWGASWCVLCTPALLLTERLMTTGTAETTTTAEGADQ